ncbi:MAG: hypothetical protein RLZ98_216 [Pseudomonadota bacterium]|jgi:localization factor PodJL
MSAQDDRIGQNLREAGSVGLDSQDLKGILLAIADRLCEEDEHRTTMLAGMHERLEALSGQTAEAAATGHLGPSDAATPPPAEVRPETEPDSHATAVSERQPVPLKSAIAPTEHLANDEFWDAEQAEALARVYEETGDLAATSSYSSAPSVDHVSSDAVITAPTEVPPVAGESARSPSIDHNEFGLLFLELADKLDNLVATMPTDATFEVLESRLLQIEQEIAGASRGSAAITEVQDRIAEIAEHLVATERQFGRIDSVETELRQLAERLSDERLATLAPAAGNSNALPDTLLHEISERIAGQVAGAVSRLPAFSDGESSGELKELLQRYIAERREGDENTVMMLDTMQQALIRLLDRVDDLEMDRTGRSGFGGFDDSHARTPAAPTPARTPEASPAATEKPEEHSDNSNVAAVAYTIPATKVDVEATTAAEPGEAGSTDTEPALAATLEPTVEPQKPALSDRAAMVASARRAAQQATEQRAKEEAEAAAQKARGKQAQPRTAASAKPGLARSRIAVGAVILLGLGIGYQTYAMIAKSALIPGAATNASVIAGPKSQKGAMADGSEAASQSADTETSAKSTTSASAPELENPSGGQAADQATVSDTSLTLPAQKAVHTADADAPAPPETATASFQPPAGNSKLELPPSRIGPLSLRLAAAKGDPSAEFEVASRFAEGKGIDHDLKAALSWYKRSASRGFGAAQYRLATLYERGIGVERDLARSRTWYQRAAEQGHVKAMHNLGVLAAGDGKTNPDYSAAAHWFGEAAEFGLKDSQFNLAILYDSGLGVNRNPQMAYKWFAIAARGGDDDAKKRMLKAQSKLTQHELAAVQSEIDSWMPRPKDQLVNDARAAGQLWQRRSASHASN